MKRIPFLEKLQEKLGAFASKINKNIYVLAIRDAMMAYMPFTFIASIFLIIAYPPVQGIADFITSVIGVEQEVWQAKLLYINSVTLNISGLLVTISASKSLADRLNINAIQVILTSVVSFLLLTPQVSTETGDAIEIVKIGAQSIFLAFVVSMLSAKIYQFISNKGFKIKMPSSVPPAVSAPFESIIPSFFVITLFWIIRLLCEGIFNSNALDLINYVLGIPLTTLGGSLFGIVVAKICEQLLWFFGIHGGSLVSGVMTPILQVLEDGNKSAVIAGGDPVNIISNSFFTHFAGIGIVGAVIAIFIVAKSKRYKEMGKIAGVPYVFNIGEPALFGIPLMLNVTYFIPFVFACAVNTIIAYIAFAIGIVPLPSGLVQLPWTTPLLLSGYLVTGSVMGAILQLVEVVVATLIWIPFIKIEDRKIVSEEQVDTFAEES
ncbi:PTS sugar transporter subunit IIC [Listeria costaricensis]|uniref:PTS sugar transporter subunit IIC n=1 Tax=Listeria costaricensis TaxID=2026604 RepID=UPI000C081A76|nr:PTS transporter subunit EIIC [Listeria costaricensis]